MSEPFSLPILDQISKAIPLFDSKFNGDSENGVVFCLYAQDFAIFSETGSLMKLVIFKKMLFFIFPVLSEPFPLPILDQISKAIPLLDSKFNGDSENRVGFWLYAHDFAIFSETGSTVKLTIFKKTLFFHFSCLVLAFFSANSEPNKISSFC